MRLLALLLALSSVAWAAKNYQTGTLADISRHTETRGGFVAGGTGTTSVTDVIYELSVSLGDTMVTGRYSPRTVFSYEPTDFVVNNKVEVALEGNKMYLKRPNGKELKLSIVKRVSVSASSVP